MFQRGCLQLREILHDLKRSRSSYLLLVGQGWVDKFAIEDAGALSVWRQEPDHKGDLQLKVKREPEK